MKQPYLTGPFAPPSPAHSGKNFDKWGGDAKGVYSAHGLYSYLFP